jgi:nitrogen fixation/metabolism regulation signal transduction histidine kinase
MDNDGVSSPSKDDLRAASGLVVSLSSYVMTATLAVLGAQAVVATFVIDKRKDLTAFYIVSVAGTLVLILSIILGGQGMDEIIKSGARGAWKVRTSGRKFNLQSILALLGAILVVISAFLGNVKK